MTKSKNSERIYNYAWEKYYGAVFSLAVGEWPLRDRLWDAYISNIIRLQDDELPAALLPKHKSICNAFNTHEALADEGSAKASAQAMEHWQARKVAEDILSVFISIVEASAVRDHVIAGERDRN